MITMTNGMDTVTFYIHEGAFRARHEYFEGDDFYVTHSKADVLASVIDKKWEASGCFSFPGGEVFIGGDNNNWILEPVVGDMLVIDTWTVGQLLKAINAPAPTLN